MNTIKMVEETFSDGEGKISPAWSSFHPSVEPFNVSHVQPPSQDEDEQHGPKGHYLPCHYFDFICGTSTGG
jgi:hypothetical protein